MKAKRFISFCQQNVVFITGIGIIVGTHWAWNRLQHNPRLVPEEQRKDLPIIMGMQYISRQTVEKIESLFRSGESNDKVEAKK